MNVNRREVLAGLGGLAAAATVEGPRGRLVAQAGARPLGENTDRRSGFPRKADFLIDEGYTYINAAYIHPIPSAALEAARRATLSRGSLPASQAAMARGEHEALSGRTRALFAELINARPSEIAYVPNTSTGENLVVQALELDRKFHGNVVTDALHFEGALMNLLELQKKGLDVRIVRPTKEFRIDMKDLEKVVDKNTRLIEVSSAAMYNGFQHDLKAVADLAHAHGAYVYADIIQSAGAEPLDIKAVGVDFAACSTFKWLMGDFGLGFLYVREELLDKIQRPWVGYFQAAQMVQHSAPFDAEAGNSPVTYTFSSSAAGVFEMGTLGSNNQITTALVEGSLGYIKELGVANIAAHRQPLLKKLREEVPRLGFVLVTPPESTSGSITFAKKDVGRGELPNKLQAARVNVRFSPHWMRLSPSVYNDMKDVDRFLEVLSLAQ